LASREGRSPCPKRFPRSSARDVIAEARSKAASLSRIARDFGVSESCLHRWLKVADVEAELGELQKRNRLLEQENGVLRRTAIYLGQELNPNDLPVGP
jgi:transposase